MRRVTLRCQQDRIRRAGVRCIAVVLAALVGGSSLALAQRAKDTLRVGFAEPIGSILLYDEPQPEMALVSRAVFDALLCYDARSGEFQPLLARSWKWLNERTLELVLRDDVKFHDGSDFDADDVVYTLNWLVDPAAKLRFADNYAFIERATRIDRHTVRIAMQRVAPEALLRLSISIAMLPSDKHGPLANKSDFGRKTPIGTGPYRAESVSADKGVALVRNPGYRHGGACKPAGRIGRIHAVPIPDLQTQLAHLSTGGLELARIADKNLADLVAASTDLRVTATQGLAYQFLAMDSANRSGHGALANPKVREAVALAIDREALARSVLPGGDAVTALDALCLPAHRACEYSVRPPAFDRGAARKLLAEAGFAGGFDIELAAMPGSFAIGEALAGELRKVGIRARVERMTFVTYRDRQRQGKLQLYTSLWTSGGLPDASSPAAFFFAEGARDFTRDPAIHKLIADGLATHDEARRRAIYRELYDRANRLHYVLPIATKPDVFVHTKDLVIERGTLSPFGTESGFLAWRTAP